MISRKHLVLALVVAIGCGGSPDRDNVVTRTARPDAGAADAVIADAATDAGAPDAGMAGIPRPGDDPVYAWTDLEPNNTPETAVNVGLLSDLVWIGVGEPVTTINNDWDKDFFVFKTGGRHGLPVLFSLCWNDTALRVDLLDMFLYRVEEGQKGELVKESRTNDTHCETLLTHAEAQTTLLANTTYLLEVRAVRRGGHPGVYAAELRHCET